MSNISKEQMDSFIAQGELVAEKIYQDLSLRSGIRQTLEACDEGIQAKIKRDMALRIAHGYAEVVEQTAAKLNNFFANCNLPIGRI